MFCQFHEARGKPAFCGAGKGSMFFCGRGEHPCTACSMILLVQTRTSNYNVSSSPSSKRDKKSGSQYLVFEPNSHRFVKICDTDNLASFSNSQISKIVIFVFSFIFVFFLGLAGCTATSLHRNTIKSLHKFRLVCFSLDDDDDPDSSRS